jgi:hypothetical protein
MEAATKLCTSCGLCCDGGIFSHVGVKEEERSRVRLAVLPGEGTLTFPCKHLVERACAVYEDRPRGCKRFRCKLLTSVEEGKVSLEAALGAVHRITGVHDELLAALPKGGGSTWERVASATSAPRDASSGSWLLLAGVFRSLLVRDFHDPFDAPGESTPRST